MPDFINKNRRVVQGGARTLTNIDSSGVNQWFGDTLITSRDQFVASPPVAATSRIMLTPHWYGTASLNTGLGFMVTSIQAGSGFYISTANSLGFTSASVGVWWEVQNPTA